MSNRNRDMNGDEGELAKRISERIHARRERLKMTQADVAARMRVPVPTYAGWDNGNHLPSPVDLARIASALGVHVAYLYGEISEEQMADEVVLRLYRELPPVARSVARSMIESLAVQVKEGKF